jgi:hypothetical protein
VMRIVFEPYAEAFTRAIGRILDAHRAPWE